MRSVKDSILKYIESKEGRPCYIDDMIEVLGVKKTSTQAAARQLAEETGLIEVVQAGRVWRWKNVKETTKVPQQRTSESVVSIATPDPETYRRVGKSIGGESIVVDTKGTLYKLERI